MKPTPAAMGEMPGRKSFFLFAGVAGNVCKQPRSMWVHHVIVITTKFMISQNVWWGDYHHGTQRQRGLVTYSTSVVFPLIKHNSRKNRCLPLPPERYEPPLSQLSF